MDTSELETAWKRDGYLEIETRHRKANMFKPEHSHRFDARVHILEGELTLTRDGRTQTFRAGETFEMPAGCMHSERCGSGANSFLLGHRVPTASH